MVYDDILENQNYFKNWRFLQGWFECLTKTDRWDNGQIEFFFRFGKAVANADLVIESVPEDPSIKRFIKLAAVVPKTIFASNFYNAPSQFAESTGRPAQFQHFANRYGNITQLKLWDILGRMRTYLTPLLRLRNLSEW
jgi:hypothetical protein